jgi:serine protease Do
VVIGVISAPAHTVPQEKAILGVVLSESDDGPRIDHVFQQSIAARIGLAAGDVIQNIDSQPLESSKQLVEYVSKLLPGSRVRLRIMRDGKSRVLGATLGRFSELMAADQGMEDELNRELSIRRSGFPRVLQHDSILPSNQCGGPLVDLDGRVVGLNIARAGRISTYSLPTSVVLNILPRLMHQATARN